MESFSTIASLFGTDLTRKDVVTVGWTMPPRTWPHPPLHLFFAGDCFFLGLRPGRLDWRWSSFFAQDFWAAATFLECGLSGLARPSCCRSLQEERWFWHVRISPIFWLFSPKRKKHNVAESYLISGCMECVFHNKYQNEDSVVALIAMGISSGTAPFSLWLTFGITLSSQVS